MKTMVIGGGAGGGGLLFQLEGVDLGTIETLNIVGVNHNAAIMGTTGIIYCPPAALTSHFNTNDGINDCRVADITTQMKAVSNPAPENNFLLGAWVPGTIHPASPALVWSYSTINPCSFEDLLTTIEVNITDPSGVIDTHVTGAIVGNLDETSGSGNIRVQVTGWTPDSSKYKGTVTITIQMALLLPFGGRVSVQIIHHDSVAGDFTKTQNDVFYDINNVAAAISGVTIAENGGALATKYLSGVPYRTIGSQFIINIADIDQCNNISYPEPDLVILQAYDFGLPQLSIAGSGLTGWTNYWADEDDSYNKTDWAITQVNYRCLGLPCQARGRVMDWTPTGWALSNIMNMMIDTWGQESDELSEYFTDEAYRRAGWGGVLWDSTQDIGVYAGGTGAQVVGGILKVGDTDYTGFTPAGPDYSGHSAPKDHYRRFIDVAGMVRESASLSITGFTLTQLKNSDVELWIFIPGRFVSPCYAHTLNEYDFGTFDGDNDPIRIGSSTESTIDVTFGGLGLNGAQTYFELRLVINDPAINPSSIVVSW